MSGAGRGRKRGMEAVATRKCKQKWKRWTEQKKKRRRRREKKSQQLPPPPCVAFQSVWIMGQAEAAPCTLHPARWFDKMAEKHWATRICTRCVRSCCQCPVPCSGCSCQQTGNTTNYANLPATSCRPHASQSNPIKVKPQPPLSLSPSTPKQCQFLGNLACIFSCNGALKLQIIHLKSDSHLLLDY